MEMLSNCLALIPIDTASARDTVRAVSQLLGPDGVYVNHDVAVTESQTRGDVIKSLTQTVLLDIFDESVDRVTHFPHKRFVHVYKS